MYSPVSTRRSLFASKNSPRKPLLSPSDVTPFSYNNSTETLNLFADRLNDGAAGFPSSPNVPSHRFGGSFSQPRTPVSGVGGFFPGSPASSTPSGSTFPSKSLSLGGSSSLGGGSHANTTGTPGKTMREYDESLRALDKENFKLKLRIYFLEERLGPSSRRTGAAGDEGGTAGRNNELAQQNMDLKVHVESLKYDVKEKSDLLVEAGLALEQLENRISILNMERDEERTRLESKLQGLQDDLNMTASLVLAGPEDDEAEADEAGEDLGPEVKDDDERLLREVDAEMARGLSRPSRLALMSLPLADAHGLRSPTSTTTTSTGTSAAPAGLAVVEEREAEAEVEELTAALKEVEGQLEESQQESHQRLQDLISLESELVNRDIRISALDGEMSKIKLEASEAAASHLEQLRRLQEANETRLDETRNEARRLEKEVADQSEKIKTLTAELEGCRDQLKSMEASVEEREELLKQLRNSENSPPPCSHREIPTFTQGPCPTSTEVEPWAPVIINNNNTSTNFTIHTHQLKEPSNQDDVGVPSPPTRHHRNRRCRQLQVVTQTLHIPPAASAYSMPASQDELDRLRRDMRKLREYLKTSVQERKLLLRKIGTLNERIAEKGSATATPPSKVANSNSATAFGSGLQRHQNLMSRIANLQQRLAASREDADLLRSHLESVIEANEKRDDSRCLPADLVVALRKIVEDSRSLQQSVSRVSTPLMNPDEHKLDEGAEVEGGRTQEGEETTGWKSDSGSVASWRGALPDPSLLELGLDCCKQPGLPSVVLPPSLQPILSSDQLVLSLNETLQQRNLDIEQKLTLLDALEEQMEEKDRLVQQQEELLDEYRLEIIRLREEQEQGLGQQTDRTPRAVRKHKSSTLPRRRAAGGGPTPTAAEAPPATVLPSELDQRLLRGAAMALSDGEDSWSEPDVSAARRRMGLSTHQAVLESCLQGRGRARRSRESSETDMEKQKSFYSIDYTGQDFSERGEEEDDAVIFDDYSKIIEELQSHRREIEKLQTDITNTAVCEDGSSGSGGSCHVKEDGDCGSRNPGSLDCLLVGISSLFNAMDDLGYQLDLSESLDSGRGTSEDDTEADDTDKTRTGEQDIQFAMCQDCSKVVCRDIETCLSRCGRLILSSTSSLRRLRRLCCHVTTRLQRLSEDLAQQTHLVSQLQGASSRADSMQRDLGLARDECEAKARELQELQLKMNANYKLVAELSNENLRLTGDKLKAEQLADDVRREADRLRGDLCQTRQQLARKRSGGRCSRQDVAINDNDNDGRPWTTMLPTLDPIQLRCASETSSSSFDYLHSRPRHASSTVHHHALRLSSSASSSSRRCNSSSALEHSNSKRMSKEGARRKQPRPMHADTTGLAESPHLPGNGAGGENAPTNANDISSPDLGVDVSSDPFSSLERPNVSSISPEAKLRQLELQQQMQQQHSSDSDSLLVVQNRQLRHERDVLLQKLLRSKGALKDTLDRLAKSSSQGGHDLSLASLSPLPPASKQLLQQQQQQQQQPLSSSAVLRSVGGTSSRSKVTQDLREFSRRHPGNAPSATKKQAKQKSAKNQRD